MRYSVKRPLGIIRIRSLATVPVLIPTPWSDCNWRFFVFANAFSSWCIKVKRRFSPETYNPQFSSNDFLLTFNGKCSNLDHLNSTHLVVQRELLEAHRAPGMDGQSLRVAHPALRRDPQKPVWNLIDKFSIILIYIMPQCGFATSYLSAFLPTGFPTLHFCADYLKIEPLTPKRSQLMMTHLTVAHPKHRGSRHVDEKARLGYFTDCHN